jgi:hypothetical protein
MQSSCIEYVLNLSVREAVHATVYATLAPTSLQCLPGLHIVSPAVAAADLLI